MPILEKLAYLKRRDRLTNEDVSARSGIPLSTVNKIFAGQTRNPAPHTLFQICVVFGAPICYLLDDRAPDDCCLSCVLQGGRQCLLLSNREAEFCQKYRRLSERDKRSLDSVLDNFYRQDTGEHAMEEKLLPCYLLEPGQHGSFQDLRSMKSICVPVDSTTEPADFALRISGESPGPFYPAGTILAVRAKQAVHNDHGLFLLNEELFARKLYSRNGIKKLVSIHVDLKDIPVQDSDTLLCRGVILGSIRSYRWVL